LINVNFHGLAVDHLSGHVAGMMNDRMRDAGSAIIDFFVGRIRHWKVNASVH